jgi:hypothetical protein
LSQKGLRIPSFVALKPTVFLSRFPSLCLDFGLDAKVLYDPTGSLDQWLERIRAIIDQAGLFRTGERGQFSWRWKKRPRGNWELTWEGLRELA